MPIFVYVCNSCGKNFELLLGVNQDKINIECPYCKSKEIEKTFAPFGLLGNSKEYSSGGSSKCSSCSSRSCSTCS
ncbi:MAG: zinc ribbon domain-containing protein [Candidatus Omnitrophica bacterium]|nr:zinc ribbon domain-containing protein [Candidatus Omnitrophota bacterium]MCM8826298.1 zinc ribbon domain-containing protein [Candidatus Omnitrophota bacterium]